MLLKTIIRKKNVCLGHSCKVNEDVEFHVARLENGNYQVQSVKGNFELTKICRQLPNGRRINDEQVLFSPETNIFTPVYNNSYYDFYIKIQTQLQEVVTYHLEVDHESYYVLKPFQFFVQNIVIPEHGTFKCYIKKTEDGHGFAEIHVSNPDHLSINGQNEDFHCLLDPQEKMKVTLIFIFN